MWLGDGRLGARMAKGAAKGAALAGSLALAAACSTGPGQGGDDEPDAAKAREALKAVTAAPTTPSAGAVDFRQATPGSGRGLKLGYISLGENVPFGKLVSDGVRKQAAAAGAQLVFCDSKGDAATALDCVRNFKTQGVQGYLNFQPDSKAAASICQAGPQVPVIGIDIHQPPCERAFMGADNANAGYLAGKALGRYFKQVFDCEYDAFVSMEQPEAGEVNQARMDGQRKGFTEECGQIKNLKQVNAFRIDNARTTFTDVLTSLPGAKRIVVAAINDDAILGALAAARTAGRQNDLYMAGQGADPSAHCEISKNSHWVADTAYFPERYGEIGVPYLIDLIKGKDVPKRLYVKHTIINSSNIGAFYKPSGC
ncbi:sugar ABC transporter substrate-binding protein [Actinomadura sp. NBRC 104412]|uniref:sugar ABC transporter substrate-binding protein n=1 Tax=Actinomadura sp. NBRC 104412 TaxID=3032203 RepID=UPI00249FEF47|nr:sugar ABC transporter substrate-binding protein [Actinomadura sp. NBRC 104412]GLZ06144.1 sugar ABC transporter substrate-binding protein [Actinomadura sp. NBRC 104412]